MPSFTKMDIEFVKDQFRAAFKQPGAIDARRRAGPRVRLCGDLRGGEYDFVLAVGNGPDVENETGLVHIAILGPEQTPTEEYCYNVDSVADGPDDYEKTFPTLQQATKQAIKWYKEHWS